MDSASSPHASLKLCKKCQQWLPETKEFFVTGKKSRNGLRQLCKECRRKARRKPLPHLPHSKHIFVPEGFKRCSGCYEEFPATHEFFGHRSRTKDQLYEYCKKCANEKRIQNARAHGVQPYKPADPAVKKRWIEANRERRREQERQRRITHPEQFRENKRRYRRSEHGRMQDRAYSRTRKMLKKGLSGRYSAQDIANQHAQQKGQCYWCSAKFGTGKNAYHVDHVIPVTRPGSSNDPSNLVLACPFCNQSKGNKTVEEWLIYLEKFILSKEA